ncbi:MAG: SAM-dependent methyltransferase [Pseudomonadota bacterium]
MSGLEDSLKRMIRADGPMTLAAYMAACLSDPQHGYYVTRNPIGASGDFVTAPEISQMFGELVGLSLAQHWLDNGAPAPFTMAELGPGRGTLMADVLRAGRAVPGFLDAAQIHLVEVSPTLRGVQAETLRKHAPRWHDSLATLPDAPLYLVANEYFDALPVRQFRRGPAGWAETVVGLESETLALGLTLPAPLGALDHRLEDTKPGDIVELNAPAAAEAEAIAGRIADQGGAALIFDYGDWRALGDTVQAVRDHQHVDLMDGPGTADVTAHVDFEALAEAAKRAGAMHSRLTSQGVYLERLGITQRAQALAKALTGDALETHIAAHRRLTHPAEMGTLFKCMSIHAPDTAPPPGLEP